MKHPARTLHPLLHTTPPPPRIRPSLSWQALPFELPPGVEVIMADVSCGANTPSMVKKVTAWRKADAEAEELWTQYSLASAALQDAIADLCALHSRIAAERAVEERWAAPLRR